jgi:nucleotide-binding universal stress UspA family protein
MREIRIDRVLVATDFSAACTAPLAHGVGVARHFGATVYVAHVIPSSAYSMIPLDERDPALEKIRAHAKESMAAIGALPILQGVNYEFLVDHGDLWPTLSRMADEHKVSLLVIGTHGRRAIEKLLMGSLAEEILRRSPYPVLMVGPETQTTETTIRNILFATDFSAESEPAMHFACFFAKSYGANLRFLHVADAARMDPLSATTTSSQYFSQRMAQIHWTVPEEVKPEFFVMGGLPSERILTLSEQFQSDLVVLGVRGTTFPKLAAHLPGPTAYDVVSHSRCPVLVVRNAFKSDQ